MAVLLADSFQSSLDKLNGEEQKAAKLAPFELQINPANPGLQCHRLDNIKDKNFWSPRASRDIRLVFHRVESSVMLCSVDHHDPAYDWASRRKIETYPVTGAAQYDSTAFAFLHPRVLELTYTSHDLKSWALDLGYYGPPYRFDPERRALLRAELDAYYAHLYGLSRDELRYILDPADLMGPDYPSETFRVLKNNEIRQFGEHRTQRLVLEAWDRLFGRQGPGQFGSYGEKKR